MMRWLLTLAALLLPAAPAPDAKVELVRFHDEDRSSLALRQIEFPSAQRGMAVGTLLDGTRERSVIAVTSDAGKSWTDIRLPDAPVSTFCLDEAACWLVTTGGVWFSPEAGRAWQRLSKEKLLTRVWFRDRQRGWGVGAGRKLVETRDGGRSWTPMPIAEQLKTSEDRTVFRALTFIGPSRGIIAGRVEPRRLLEPFPLWMQSEPEEEREVPALSVVLETSDGGETWKASTTSMFGRISAIRSAPGVPFAIAVVEFDRYFAYPSELFRIDLKTGSSVRVLRDKSFAVTDVAVLHDGTVLAVGFEPAGSVARTPVPGKLRVMRSNDLSRWSAVDVDYRAVARRVSASVAPDDVVWLATDTGMILRYGAGSRN